MSSTTESAAGLNLQVVIKGVADGAVADAIRELLGRVDLALVVTPKAAAPSEAAEAPTQALTAPPPPSAAWFFDAVEHHRCRIDWDSIPGCTDHFGIKNFLFGTASSPKACLDPQYAVQVMSRQPDYGLQMGLTGPAAGILPASCASDSWAMHLWVTPEFRVARAVTATLTWRTNEAILWVNGIPVCAGGDATVTYDFRPGQSYVVELQYSAGDDATSVQIERGFDEVVSALRLDEIV